MKAARNLDPQRPDQKPGKICVFKLSPHHSAQEHFIQSKYYLSWCRVALQTGLRPPCNAQKYPRKKSEQSKTRV